MWKSRWRDATALKLACASGNEGLRSSFSPLPACCASVERHPCLETSSEISPTGPLLRSSHSCGKEPRGEAGEAAVPMAEGVKPGPLAFVLRCQEREGATPCGVMAVFPCQCSTLHLTADSLPFPVFSNNSKPGRVEFRGNLYSLTVQNSDLWSWGSLESQGKIRGLWRERDPGRENCDTTEFSANIAFTDWFY